ncbi:hypothetical protein [Candidatus Reidiella endopervernicosa]|uniref:Uncharacterized protein n=1 Tax=Candidatus Reidiella endopervernicosa TaxID=2738883 RepID=A0A6N0HWA0_9GAMM|nr:hypothetical protein [Candidatus Reidiella endopervernicosa]QKQ26531.1 hypothetical protein HUE57_09740 [Candidatus Reidiella endopervernicosa]
MNISKFIMAGVLCAWAVSSYAENLKEGVPEVKTKLESFSANTGVVIVRGFEVVGKIDGLYDASIEVESKEFVNVTSGKKEYGITIEVVKEDGRYDKKHIIY